MANLDARDFLQFSNTQVLNIIFDEFEQIKSTYIREAYGRLQDIVQDRIRTQANFMISFIEENLEEELKGSLRRAYNKIEEDLVGVTNLACGQLEDVENIEDVNIITGKYLDVVLDKDTYKVNIDALADELPEQLKRYLNSKFDSVMSNQIADTIGDIVYTTRQYMYNMINNIYTELDHLVTRINVRQKDAVNHYVAEYKKSLVKENGNRYIPGFEEFRFDYNGKKIVYAYEGKNLNCYIDGQKVVNPSEIIEINRQLQDAFPEAQSITDAMVRNVSDLMLDNKQRENDVLGMKDSVERVIIPDWMIEAARASQPTPKEEELENITLDDYVKVEEDKKAEANGLLSQMEIEDLLKPEPEIINPNASTNPEDAKITEEEMNALLHGLDIPDEPVEVHDSVPDKPTPQELVQMLTIDDDVETMRKPKPLPSDLLDSLDIKDEEEPKPEVQDDDIGAIQARMDELMRNPLVMEYLELQDKMKKFYDEYKQPVEQSMEQPMEQTLPEIKPDVFLK